MNHRDERLGSAPLGKLMFSLALPSVAAQLINVLYNIVDRMYIGHIPGYGNTALTGVRGYISNPDDDLGIQCVCGNGRSTACFHSTGKTEQTEGRTDPWKFCGASGTIFCNPDSILFDIQDTGPVCVWSQ